jgi:ribosomal protein S27AE
MSNGKMICPKCGGEMNHHADEVVYPMEPDTAGYSKPDLGGVIQETHACPGCGAVASRRPVESWHR